MMGTAKWLVGFGAGYVLGARGGGERYNQIAGKAQELLRDPRVREKADQARQLVKEKVGGKGSDNGTGSGSSSSSGAATAGGTTSTRGTTGSGPGSGTGGGRSS
jgi:hypothetical protein